MMLSSRVATFFIKILLALWINVLPLSAQDTSDERDDRGFIAGLLEDSLGGEGRTVRIDGFAGALSSKATIDKITISDPVGPWLTLQDIELNWNRSALLRGRIEVTSLSAATVDLARLPEPVETELPEPEATEFALPELPVSLEIDSLDLTEITLGAPILGDVTVLQMTSSASLIGGEADVLLQARRIDGQQGDFDIKASYKADQSVVLSITLQEEPDGIAARMLNLPGRPGVSLELEGEGTLDDLVTEVSLKTAGQDRLSGQVTLKRDAETLARKFDADIQGDLAPLLPAEYKALLGDNVTLRSTGRQDADGALTLEALDLQTAALRLNGSLDLRPDYLPARFALSGEIAMLDGAPVILPGGTQMAKAGVNLAYDVAEGPDWSVVFDVTDLENDTVQVAAIELLGKGQLDLQSLESPTLNGGLTFDAKGLQFVDPAVQAAVGAQARGSLNIDLGAEQQLNLSGIHLIAAGVSFVGDVVIDGLDSGFESSVDAELTAQDLSNFAELTSLAGLRGYSSVQMSGTADLGGSFDIALKGIGRDLAIGVAQADQVLNGETRLDIAAVRDQKGTRLPRLILQNDQVELTAQADLTSGKSSAGFDAKLRDGTLIDPRLRGAVSVKGTALDDGSGWAVDVQAQGPLGATAAVAGKVTGAQALSLRYDAKVNDVSPFAPGVQGGAALQGTVNQEGDGLRIVTSFDGPYQLSGDVDGILLAGASTVNYQMRLPNIAVLGTGISGPVAFAGTAAEQQGGAWGIDAVLTGLSGTNGQIKGVISDATQMDVQVSGRVPLGLVNPLIAPRNIQGIAQLDLRLQGAPEVANVSGEITTAGSRLSIPSQALALTDLGATVRLNRGRAAVQALMTVSSGGQIAVDGGVTLLGAPSTDLTAQLRNVRLADEALYETLLNGAVRFAGPLQGGALISGQIDVGETNIRVPSSETTGFAIIPQIQHIGATSAVQKTQTRAGLNQTETASDTGTSAPIGLNLDINAPSRVFVRGRGLDAELGGSVILRGDTNNVISSGGFELIRGRLDILSKRFVLEKGLVTLGGTLDPTLEFVAQTTTDAGTAQIIVEGAASAPEVRFSATPDAPEDQILAQIFFGRSISELSAFQAVQLANAIATLAGSGGEGLIAKLRKGFNLDDFDVNTDDEGNTSVRAGKYLSENVYTDVTLGDGDAAGVSLNIDLTPNLTARGAVQADGNSSLGIFFERDY